MSLVQVVSVVIAFSLLQDGALARRGGGGGFRGGSIRGSRGGSFRGGSFRYRGGSGLYQGTSYYSDHQAICYTTDSSVVDFSNSTETGAYFVCPFKDSDTHEHVYCCGPETNQHCCTYWDDGWRMAGAIFGFIVAGLFAGLLLYILVAGCCCYEAPGKQKGEPPQLLQVRKLADNNRETEAKVQTA